MATYNIGLDGLAMALCSTYGACIKSVTDVIDSTLILASIDSMRNDCVNDARLKGILSQVHAVNPHFKYASVLSKLLVDYKESEYKNSVAFIANNGEDFVDLCHLIFDHKRYSLLSFRYVAYIVNNRALLELTVINRPDLVHEYIIFDDELLALAVIHHPEYLENLKGKSYSQEFRYKAYLLGEKYLKNGGDYGYDLYVRNLLDRDDDIYDKAIGGMSTEERERLVTYDHRVLGAYAKLGGLTVGELKAALIGDFDSCAVDSVERVVNAYGGGFNADLVDAIYICDIVAKSGLYRAVERALSILFNLGRGERGRFKTDEVHAFLIDCAKRDLKGYVSRIQFMKYSSDELGFGYDSASAEIYLCAIAYNACRADDMPALKKQLKKCRILGAVTRLASADNK